MGQDPVALRLELLAGHPQHAGVLKLAAEKAGWGTVLPAKAGERRGRGVAVHESFHSYVAHVVEVTVAKDGTIKVDRIVSAVDCGTPINPDNIRAQIEGGIGFGLGAMSLAITLKDGVVEQGNFDSFAPLRIGDMPKVEVHIVPSSAAPTGIGEPGVPPVLPAVANAVAAATGKHLRNLPFNTSELAV
jgi:isoquinoline 1-oxidoreductase beta subunit